MTGRGRELRRGRQTSDDAPYSSPDPDYSTGLGEVLVHEEGVFRNTRSRVAIPYSYEQPSSSTTLASSQPRRSLQSSDEEDEDSGYASSTTVSLVRTDRASVNMADNVNDDLRQCLEAQEQTSRTQQEALDNIQQMLARSSAIGMTMMPGAITMRRNISAMSSQRRRNPKRVLP